MNQGAGKMAKIALMTSWNACCGVSVHAELIGEALLRLGHEIKVFAPRQYEDDGTRLYFSPDEGFVTRNFSFLRYGDRCTDKGLIDALYFDPEPILDEDFDLLIVEKPTSTPLGGLKKILPEIKEKARVIAVLHEGWMPENPYFARVEWDAVAVFDERYKDLFSPVLPEETLHVIPFPCHPLDRRDKFEAREKLGIPQFCEVVFSFSGLHQPEAVLTSLEGLEKDYPELVYLCLTGDPEMYWYLQGLGRKYEFLDVRFGRPPTRELYGYLGAADAVVINKGDHIHLVISSSVHLCLGALVPILCSDVNYFDAFGGAVMRYRDSAELEEQLYATLSEGGAEVSEKARRFLELRSADLVAERLLDIGLGNEPTPNRN